MKSSAKKVLWALWLTAQLANVTAQDSNIELWKGISLNKKITESFKISITPELRFSEEFRQREWILESGFEYQPYRFLEIDLNYRYSNLKESDSENEFIQSHTYGVDANLKYPINRFDFSLRTRLTNYNEFGESMDFENPYLRYRLKSQYDIANSKFSPKASIEFFHQLNENEVNKVRYSAGVEYKFGKHYTLGFDYHFQEYLKKDKQRNIFEISSKFKF